VSLAEDLINAWRTAIRLPECDFSRLETNSISRLKRDQNAPALG
jgi:hypothetical protein